MPFNGIFRETVLTIKQFFTCYQNLTVAVAYHDLVTIIVIAIMNLPLCENCCVLLMHCLASESTSSTGNYILILCYLQLL